METGLSTLISWQFLMLSLGINILIFIFRTFMEFCIKNLPNVGLWSKLFLPIAPSITGGFVGFFLKQFPYPDGITSTDARVLFGAVAGFLSGLLYQVLKGMLKSRIQGFIQDDGVQQNQMQSDSTDPTIRARPIPPIENNPQIIPFNNS